MIEFVDLRNKMDSYLTDNHDSGTKSLKKPKDITDPVTDCIVLKNMLMF